MKNILSIIAAVVMFVLTSNLASAQSTAKPVKIILSGVSITLNGQALNPGNMNLYKKYIMISDDGYIYATITGSKAVMIKTETADSVVKVIDFIPNNSQYPVARVSEVKSIDLRF